MGFSPGAATDILSRLFCAKMTELTGRPFMVESRTSPGGQISISAVAKAAPDGCTIGMSIISNNAAASAVHKKLTYPLGADFGFFSGLWKLPNLLVVSNSLGVNPAPDLIPLLKNNPNKYMFASSDLGTTVHLSGELFKYLAKVEITHVPYCSGKPALISLIAGRAHMLFDTMPGPPPYARDGSVRGLTVTTAEGNPATPDIPAVAEFLPGYELPSWTAIFGPAGIRAEAGQGISELANSALRSPDLVTKIQDLAATFWPTTAAITPFRASEEIRPAQAVKSAGIALN